MIVGEDVTSDWLRKELAAAEGRLAKNERKRRHGDQAVVSSPLQRLAELNDEVDCLELSQDVAMWGSAPEPSSLVEEAQRCTSLGRLLCKHKVPSSGTAAKRLYDTLWTEEYEPFHRYVRTKLIISLRQSLREAGYLSEQGCSKLLEACQDFDAKEASVASYCYWLARVQDVHNQVVNYIDGKMGMSYERSEVIVELCRPLVEKVRFHFVDASQDRITSTRLERLPEWVLGYIREHVFEGGPWDLVVDGVSRIVEDAPFQFLSEIVQLAQHVLTERNFFRHNLIAGPNSNPLHLTHGIEQLLLFDSYVRDLLPEQRVPVGLSQSMIASDAELFKWWLDRERESTLSAIFDTEVTERPPGRVSPQSELFCALLYSIQSKASLFQTPGPYLSHVAAPLCMNFLDAIHASATDLRGLLSQRKLPSDQNLRNNMEEWIELINGVHIASINLHKRHFGLSTGAGSDHDLARVGRSFERLREVMVDECATTIVETVLMERAKLASYLMRCSHLLAIASTDASEDSLGLSPDLHDVSRLVSLLLAQCNDSGLESDATDHFAPAAIRLHVIDRLADKILEVVQDAHGMTPDLNLKGCLVVAEDAKVLFTGLDSQLAARLLGVASFMTMDSRQMHSLRMALFGLAQPFSHPDETPLLNYSQFSLDGTLLDEAMSMLRAKGYALHLEDAISILNRRKDSFL
jgi:hypothetical protein